MSIFPENRNNSDHEFHYQYRTPQINEGGMHTDQFSPPKKRGGKGTKILAWVLATVLLGASAGAGGAAIVNSQLAPSWRGSTQVQESVRPKVETVVNSTDGALLSPKQLYADNLPSCVGITVSTTSVNIFGQPSTSAASGSGFVLTADGYIVTNFHVIEDAANDASVSIEVSFANEKKYAATLVGGEKDNDIAVLKIDAQGLVPVTLGDSDRLVVGEAVYAIGNPLGELTYSLTDGIISARDRLITTSSTNRATGAAERTTLNVLQTNCAINPGNSGGPLFDAYGDVIGIVSAKYAQSGSGVSAEGLGFALPINDVKEILKDLIANGYVTGKPYLGVQVSDVSDEAQTYGIAAGAAVQFVADGSCAQKAGLAVGDIIVSIDDTAIDSASALTAALAKGYRAGDTAKFTIIRQQKELAISIKFDEKNTQTEANNQLQQPQRPQQPQGGGYFEWPFGWNNW